MRKRKDDELPSYVAEGMVRNMKADFMKMNNVDRVRYYTPDKVDEYKKLLAEEGDEYEWKSKEGYICNIRRNHMGAWCGYVFLPKGHKLYGKHYDDVDVEVHGGLTFSEEATHKKTEQKFWVFGFDTAHAGDFVYGLGNMIPDREIYRNKEYMINETNYLAEQLYKIYLDQLD